MILETGESTDFKEEWKKSLIPLSQVFTANIYRKYHCSLTVLILLPKVSYSCWILRLLIKKCGVLGTTLNCDLWFKSPEECWVPLLYDYSQVHSDSKWQYLLGSHIWFEYICFRIIFIMNSWYHKLGVNCSEFQKKIKIKRLKNDLAWFGLYGISIIVGYLMPNPVYTYISYLPTPPLGQDMTQGQFLSRV